MVRRFGAVSGPGASHVAAMSAIGHELQARGHQVTPLDFPGKSKTDTGVSGGNGQKGFLKYMIERARWICENVPDRIAAAQFDCLLVDAIDPATATVAEALRIPYVTVNNALPLNSEPLVPPDFLPWSFHDAWWARVRNTVGYKVRNLVISPLNKTLNSYRRRWNLRPYRTPEDSLSTLAQITQLVREFDLPHIGLPPWFHYVGPYHREPNDRNSFPYNQLDGRPLIYASLGTRQSIDHPLWKEISESCLGLDAQLVIALGHQEPAGNRSELPGHPIVVAYAPQLALLSRAALAIMHGGLNSTMEALGAGVPLVVLPLTGDQFGVAARVAYTGVGQTIEGSRCKAPRLRQLVSNVLASANYRQRAQELKQAIRQTGGIRQAADIVEEAVATNQSVIAK